MNLWAIKVGYTFRFMKIPESNTPRRKKEKYVLVRMESLYAVLKHLRRLNIGTKVGLNF